MCDVCLEIFAVYTVECEAAGEPVDLSVVPMELYLQETRRVAEAVLRLEKRPEPKPNSISAILLCRILDVLQEVGTDSPVYEKLLRSAWVRQTIAAESASDLGAGIRAMDLPFLNEDALRLYHTETWFSEKSSALQRLPTFPAAWRVEVLRHLRDWWLRGEGLGVNPEALVPEADLLPEDRLKFKRLLRVYYIALLQTENAAEERQLLQDIVLELPMHSWGLDLWLKRLALARLAFWDPIELPFLDNENRGVLYYYAALKSGISLDNRERLADRLEKKGCSDGIAYLRGNFLRECIAGK